MGAGLGLVLILALTLLLKLANHSPVRILWSIAAPGTGERLAVGPDGTIYQAGFGFLRAYDTNGHLRWTLPRGIWVNSAPAIGQDGTIYLREAIARFTDGIAGTNSGLLALHPDGSVKWRFPMPHICDFEGLPTGMAFALDNRDTVYFITASGFFTPKSLMAVSKDGRELWHFDSTNNWVAPLEVAPGEAVLFHSSDGTNRCFLRFGTDGRAGDLRPQQDTEDMAFTTDWEGVVYLPGMKGATMTALNPDGSLRWAYRSAFRGVSVPTIAADSSLYFTAAIKGRRDVFLVALTRNGKKKWEFRLGPHWNFNPPTVAADGTLFVVSSDPKLTALNPDGTLRWVFKPQRRFSKRVPTNWRQFKQVLSEDLGSGMNVFVTPPALTADGVLYVGFGSPYDRLYALNVGVGLATNSPWPMEAGNPRLTWSVAGRHAALPLPAGQVSTNRVDWRKGSLEHSATEKTLSSPAFFNRFLPRL